ncbi:MAG: hypothetical protein QOF44_511 [Streptomyces sp.]|nr:hypothetical protein [Streptomyces sp.]
MRKRAKNSLISALAAATLLMTGCSAADGTGARATSGTGTEAVAKTVSSSPSGSPAAATAGSATSTAGTTSKVASAAVAHAADGGGSAKKSSLKVASYDAGSGRAVISDSASSKSAVAVGDVVASAPVPSAPDGLLVKVTQVLGETDKGTKVDTAPATLRELLGKRKVNDTVSVDPSSVDVKALNADVKVSGKKGSGATFGADGAKVPLGSLRVDVSDSVETADGAPASAKASIKGYVQLAPVIEFAYDGDSSGTGTQPVSASLVLSGDWASQWELDGQASAAQKGTRVPFAELHTDVVIYVGPVPVVVNLGYVLYYQVDADGKVSVHVSQSATGDFKAGGNYTRATGWTPVSEADLTATPVKSSVTTAGNAKATLGAEASVGLYGAADVTVDVAPYLRVSATGRATGTSGGTGSAVVAWAVYGGYDVTGTLNVHLTIFSTSMDKSVPLFAVHREKKLDDGGRTISSS